MSEWGINNTQFRVEIGRAIQASCDLEICWQRSVTQFREKLVEAEGLRGVVRIALSSPEWGSPGKETDKEW
jgi:hypothetical protein